MSDSIYSNLQSYESSVSGTVTESFDLFSKEIVVVNDSDTTNMTFYPKGITEGSAMTVKPKETITLERFRTGTFSIVTTAPVDYRVWIIG